MELSEAIAKSLDLLVKGEALALSLNPNEGYHLAFSGGKDSQVLLHLAQLAGVRFRAYYNVCGLDSPENVYFIRKHYPDVKWLHPKEKIIQLIRKKGLPTMNVRYCCERTKESQGKGCVVLTGVRAEESHKRAKYAAIEIFSRRVEHQGKDKTRSEEWLKETEHECIKGQDRVMVRPMLHWTEAMVWEYINKNNIPVNPCYANRGRVGCMFCPFSSKKEIERCEHEYQGFYRAILSALKTYWAKTDKHELSTPIEYYEWWKSKKSLTDFKASKPAMPSNG